MPKCLMFHLPIALMEMSDEEFYNSDYGLRRRERNQTCSSVVYMHCLVPGNPKNLLAVYFKKKNISVCAPKITVKRRSKGTSFLFMSPGSRRKNGYDRSRTCVSRVKSPVHSRFATYPDVSCRAHDVRGRWTSGGRPFSDDRSGAKTVGSAPTGVERRL